MAKFKGRGFDQTVVNLKRLQARNLELVRLVQSGLPRTMLQAGLIVQARAQEILTEKGHVVTGNLRRSINTQLVEATETRVTVAVGTFVVYGPFIESLPDDGYLYPASVQTTPQTVPFIYRNGIAPYERHWGRA